MGIILQYLGSFAMRLRENASAAGQSLRRLTPLGLMRDPDDNGHLILDPETAPVIRKIYNL
ncbi:Hypothetical protein EUBREC_2321 [Agathobacter rectalis ATCC 33656]|uniref:Uncharacterized protein n=1 Tax=Agathobacter rectalis (strain ATCC 33656 / DSM 3377 / JCM 17463 / KCTC 5835 / VPI 0990) TaxID=515619 RepID=C4ZD92_AGARV|nr:Hypothetical protein EUBREC_2321 [Agathobacter rectalis ATCC 33656]